MNTHCTFLTTGRYVCTAGPERFADTPVASNPQDCKVWRIDKSTRKNGLPYANNAWGCVDYCRDKYGPSAGHMGNKSAIVMGTRMMLCSCHDGTNRCNNKLTIRNTPQIENM